MRLPRYARTPRPLRSPAATAVADADAIQLRDLPPPRVNLAHARCRPCTLQAARLYPREGAAAMSNNSSIEPADILAGERAGAYAAPASRFSKLGEARYVEAVLQPGDMLYIPRGWWHFVKSLSTSISLAYHFR